MPSREELENARLEEAARWVQRLDAGEGADGAFERWRSDPANALAYIRVKQASQWIDNNQASLAAATKPAQGSKALSRRAWIGGAVAAGVTTIGVGFLVYGVMNDRAVARTDVGERTSLSLPDGGRLDVNTSSEVSWKFGGEIREVWLKRGEIALEIAADARPFRLHVGDRVIALKAGRYNVRSHADKAAITVLSGEGATTAGSGKPMPPSVFPEGSVAELNKAGVEVKKVDDHTLEAVSAWKDDELVLDNLTLKQAVAEYNRYLKKKIVIGDPSLDDLRLGGRFATRDPAEFLNALRMSFDIQTIEHAEGVTLSPR